MDPRAYPAGLLPGVGARLEGLIAMLEAMVDIDSGPSRPDGARAVLELVADRLVAAGWQAGPPKSAATVLIASRPGERPVSDGGRRVLLMTRPDTDVPGGPQAGLAFRADGTRAYGAGIADGKGGLATALGAVEVLLDDGLFDDFAEITLASLPAAQNGATADDSSMPAIGADVVLGLEAATRRQAPASDGLGVMAREVALALGFDDAGRSPSGVTAIAAEREHATALGGLGPTGGETGTTGEWVDLTSIVPRAARLAGLIARTGGDR